MCETLRIIPYSKKHPPLQEKKIIFYVLKIIEIMQASTCEIVGEWSRSFSNKQQVPDRIPCLINVICI